VAGAVTDAQLAARVEHLERVARRDRVLALAVLALALVTAPAPAAQTHSAPVVVQDASGRAAWLTAKGLLVADPSSKLRADAGIDNDGYPSVDLYDRSEKIRLGMYLLKERPVLQQFDKAGNQRAELSLAEETENGEFAIRDANHVTRAAVFHGAQGLPELALYGTDGKVRAYLSAGDAGPYLVMNDNAGASRVVSGRYDSGKFGMDVRGASGTPTWTKP
jgi:hypothetical protein